MRVIASFTSFIPTIVNSVIVEQHVHSDLSASITVNASPAPMPVPALAVATSFSIPEVPELRQALGPRVPAVAPAVPAPAGANPAVLPANPVAAVVPPTTILALPGVTTVTDDFTVQWMETWIGGTYSTWIPQTFFFHFPERTPGPPPGKGEIGMGTLTGQAGQTRMVVMGAAATQGPAWLRGVAAAMGAGFAGMLV